MTRVAEWFLGIVGGIAAFLGVFILVGGEGQSIGLGGDLTWEIGEISSAWGWGLLAGGAVLLFITTTLVVWDLRHPRVRQPQSEFAGLMSHLGIFVIVNAVLWAQDFAAGGGLEYAYWATIPWGAGLLIHGLAYLFSGRKEDQAARAEMKIEETPRKELQRH
jgi:hypothetical protein